MQKKKDRGGPRRRRCRASTSACRPTAPAARWARRRSVRTAPRCTPPPLRQVQEIGSVGGSRDWFSGRTALRCTPPPLLQEIVSVQQTVQDIIPVQQTKSPPMQRGTSLMKTRPPPLGRHRALGMFLLQGPRGALFLMTEVPLHSAKPTGVTRNQGHAPPPGWSYAPRTYPTVGSGAVRVLE